MKVFKKIFPNFSRIWELRKIWMSLLDGYRVLLNENTLHWPTPACLDVGYVFIACL